MDWLQRFKTKLIWRFFVRRKQEYIIAVDCPAMIDLKVRALHYGSNWNIADRNQDVIVVRDALVTTGQEKKQRQHTKLFDGWKW